MPVEPSLDDLRNRVRDLHGCESRWIESVPVHETYEGETVWEGEVQVFDLIEHPEAPRCYAWVYETDEGTTRYLAVLHAGPVTSPLTAVQAAIVADSKDGGRA